MKKSVPEMDDTKKPLSDMEVIEVEDIDYDGFQVVRGEFFQLQAMPFVSSDNTAAE